MKKVRLIAVALIVVLCTTLSCVAQDQEVQLLKQLSDAPGPSGYEGPVRAIMVKHMTPLATKITYDGVGSVIAQQGATGPRIMIDAHMDEVGAMVRSIDADGFLRMQMLGYWMNQALIDQRWTIIGSKGPVIAVTGMRDVHIATSSEIGKVFPVRSLFLDIGAKSAAQAKEMGIEPGDPIVPYSPFEVLNGTSRYLGKAFDDRVGCALLIEVMKRLEHVSHPNQLFYAATVQEEVGMRGAVTASQVIKPDIGIVLEAGIVKDTPDVEPGEAEEVLGGGPAYFLYDESAIPNRKLVTFVKNVAAKNSIPLQYDLVEGYGEDGASIQMSNGGVPIINLVVPIRYTHSHNGIISRHDIDRMADLLVAMIMNLDSKTVANIRNFAPQ